MSHQIFSSPDAINDTEVSEPALYRVLLLNDDYSPMDFVVFVLKQFFGHNESTAQKIMLDVHKKGSGLAGVFSFEVAETKAEQVNSFSRQNKYPLKCIIEEETEQ
jgi:ATP-dependent Clp protease adaptor protein ClpS